MELKLVLDEDGLAAVRDSRTLAALGLAPPKTSRLRAIYFDTRDHRLGQAGMGLRVREEDGRWVQTLKMGANVRLGLSTPIEGEWEVPQPRPDLSLVDGEPLRDALTRALGTRELRRQFETVFVREKCLAQPAAGGLVEIAIDHGQVHAENGEDVVREVEIELKEGPPVAILLVAEAVFSDIAFRLGVETKAERGYRLLAGRPARTLADAAAEDAPLPALAPDMTARAALEAIGTAWGASALAHADRILRDDHPEGPHQTRVYLRRLRTLLAAFRPAFDGDRLRRIADEARSMARLVGELRDADVLATEVVPDGAKGAGSLDRAAVDRLLARIETERAETRARVVESLAGSRWSWLTLQLALFPLVVARAAETGEGPGADMPLAELAAIALKKAWKRVDRWGRRIESLSIDERHEMRKALKRLRYEIEIFGALWPAEEVAGYVRHLKKMQDVFGYLNDVETARGALGRGARPEVRLGAAGFELAPTPHDPATAAAAAIVGWHERRSDKAWETAQKRWRKLKDTPRFWREPPADFPAT